MKTALFTASYNRPDLFLEVLKGLEQNKVDLETENNSSIYIYSFALEPEKLQPTGPCNFSRLKKLHF